MLSHIAETEEGFFLVITSLVNGFPIVESPFLQDFVSTILDGCDLPTRVLQEFDLIDKFKTLLKFAKMHDGLLCLLVFN